MQRIEAVIRTEMVHECVKALDSIGTHGVTVYEAKGHGVQGGLESSWNGSTRRVTLLPKAVLVAVVDDHECQRVVDTIMTAAHTGHPGDGKIFVSSVDNAFRVRTGEIGPEAL